MARGHSKDHKRSDGEGSHRNRSHEKNGNLLEKDVSTSAVPDLEAGTQADPGGGINGYETICTEPPQDHKSKRGYGTRSRNGENPERAFKADMKDGACLSSRVMKSAGKVRTNPAVSGVQVTDAHVVGGSIHDKDPVQHFEERDMGSVEGSRKRRKSKQAIENGSTGDDCRTVSIGHRIGSVSFPHVHGRQRDLEGSTISNDAIQDSKSTPKRKRTTNVRKDFLKEDALSKNGIATVSELTASSLTDLLGHNRDEEHFADVHGLNTRGHHGHAKEREVISRKHKRKIVERAGELHLEDKDPGGMEEASSRKQVALVDQISSLSSVDLCQHVDFSQVSKSYTESHSGQAFRPQCSDSEPFINSPQGFCEYDNASITQEHSVSNKSQIIGGISDSVCCTLFPEDSSRISGSINKVPDGYHSNNASLMESVTSDHYERGGKAPEEPDISAHRQIPLEAAPYDVGASNIQKEGTIGAYHGAIVSKHSNQDDVSHLTQSVPSSASLDANKVPSTLLRVSDIDIDSMVASHIDELFPISLSTGAELSTRTECFLDLENQENVKYLNFVPVSGGKSTHGVVASKSCVAAPSYTGCASVSSDSFRADSSGLLPTEISSFLQPVFAPKGVASGCQECDAGSGVSCVHLQTCRVDAQHKNSSFSDLILEDYAPSSEAFSSSYPESSKDRGNLSKIPIEGTRAEQSSRCTKNFEQAEPQLGVPEKVRPKRKVRDPCLEKSKETLQRATPIVRAEPCLENSKEILGSDTKKKRGNIARKTNPYQESLKRRKREIMRRAKGWASEAGFLKVVDKYEDKGQQENHVILSEPQRDEFVKAMVETCRNNSRLRTSFLCSVKAIVDLGLLQLPAQELLTQRSSKEAEDVIKSWKHLSNESSSLRSAYLELFESVDKLHSASPTIVPELSLLQAPWSCTRGEERVLDVQLPKTGS